MSYFLDISKLTNEDLDEIKHLARAFNLNFNQAMWRWMNKNPDKINVLGEMKNGEFIRDEINEDGVKEFRGKEGIVRMIKQVLKNKEKNNEN